MKIKNLKLKIRKLLSIVLVILIVLSSIKFLILKPKNVLADSYFSFNEGAGNLVNDSNGSVASATYNAAVWKDESMCKFGKCLSFDGTINGINVPDDPNLDFAAAEDFTVEGWFRTPDITTGTRAIAGKVNAGGPSGGYKVYMNSSGNIVFGIDDDAVGFPEDSASTTPTAFDDNKWHHFAGVKTGTTSITIYVDGKQYQTDSTLSATGTLANSGVFYMGYDNGANKFTGFLDEIRVYRSARTSAQILTDIAGVTDSRGITASFGPDISYLSNGLIGYWKMDDNTGSAPVDSSGNAHTGTFVNTPTWVAGKYGPALNFAAASSQGVTAAAAAADVQSGDMSTSFWFTPTTTISGSLASEQSLVAMIDGSATNYFWVLLTTSGTVRLRVNGSNADTTTSTWTAGTFYHIVATFSTTEGMKIFVNGVLQGTNTNTSRPTTSISTNFYIGESTSSRYFSGKIDELRLYNRSLSTQEARKIREYAAGPIAWFKMDENTGTTTTIDSSGYGSTATLTEFTNNIWSTGKFGSGINFSGVDNWIDFYSTALNSNFLGSQGSIALWFKISSSSVWTDGTSKTILKIGPDTNNTITIQKDTPSNQMLIDYVAGGTDEQFTVSTSSTDWVHFEITWDKNADQAKMYVNGILSNTSTALGTWAGALSSTRTSIGNNYNGTAAWNGILDDIKIYNYARNQNQVVEDLNGNHPAPGSPIGSAFAYWKFDEGSDNSCSGGTNDVCNSGNAGSALDGAQSNMAVPGTSTSGWTNSGKFGKALNFDDNNDYVSVTQNGKFNLSSSPFSISAWVLDDETAANLTATADRIVSWYDGSKSIQLVLNGNSGNRQFALKNNSGSASPEVTSTGNLSSGWHHVVATFDGVSTYHIYVDGKQSDGGTGTNIDAFTANSTTLYIGQRGDASTGTVKGTLDEIKIYNVTLSPDQVYLEYNRGSSASMGSLSTDSSNNPSNSDTDSYCPPGQGSTCVPPVGEWNFDENTGSTTTYDSSSNGNTGTISNFSSWKTGKFGSALEFNNSNTIVNAGSATVLDNLKNTGMTAEAWIYPHASNANGSRIFDKSSAAAGNRWLLSITGSASALTFQHTCTPTADLVATTANILTMNAWNHVAVTWTGSTAGTSVTFYLNGKKSAVSAPQDCNNTLADDSANNLAIGDTNATGTRRPFDGYIDEAKIYNYVRTPAQIAWDMNRGEPSAWWKLDESSWSGAASEVKDSGGSTLHGVRSGNATTATGKLNNGGTFDGTGDGVSIADSDILSFGVSTADTPFSISAWVNPNSVTSRDIISKVNDFGALNDEYEFYFDSSNHLALTLYDKSASATIKRSWNSTFPTGTWAHVVATYDGSGTAAGIKLYVNGLQRDDTTSTSGTYVAMENTTATVIIGGWTNSSNAIAGSFNGLIDDVRMYNYPLTSQQIKTIMNNGAAVKY